MSKPEHDCGCGSPPDIGITRQTKTRREFVAQMLKAGFAIGAVASLGVTFPDRASAAVDPNCKETCYATYTTQIAACARMRNKAKKAACYIAANAALAVCYAACNAQEAGEVVKEIGQWIVAHPRAVIGTIVVIGGIILIVGATDGGRIVLIPRLIGLGAKSAF